MSNTLIAIISALVLSFVLTLSHGLLRAAAAYSPMEWSWLIRIGPALFLYALVFFVYSFLLKKIEISILYPAYTALSIIGVSMIGMYYFGEPVSLLKIFGILVLLAGVVMISL